ncbi:MAG: DNA polymerase III subunit epsilon [Pseudomonadota bacterium]
MRQVVLDTETTGFEHEDGHRIIEVGCIELNDRQSTGRTFHEYINPERDLPRESVEIHGLTNDFLDDKPRFAEIADDLIEFIRDSELIMHNASFDVGHLNAEFARLDDGIRTENIAEILDTLKLAQGMHPGQRNSLDALCKRYEVDNSNRTLHGALLDAELLAEVYLLMTGGQVSLGLDLMSPASGSASGNYQFDASKLQVRRASAEEIALHEQRLKQIQQASGETGCLWLEQTKAH